MTKAAVTSRIVVAVSVMLAADLMVVVMSLVLRDYFALASELFFIPAVNAVLGGAAILTSANAETRLEKPYREQYVAGVVIVATVVSWVILGLLPKHGC